MRATRLKITNRNEVRTIKLKAGDIIAVGTGPLPTGQTTIDLSAVNIADVVEIGGTAAATANIEAGKVYRITNTKGATVTLPTDLPESTPIVIRRLPLNGRRAVTAQQVLLR